MTTPALELRGIGKSFGKTRVLEGGELAAAQGEFVALVGPSGCGKSTLLRIAAGLETPDEGSVHLADTDVTAMRAADRDVAMVFQSYALYPHLTARQNMALPLFMRRLSTAERLPLAGLLPGVRARMAAIGAEVATAAEVLRITPLLDRKPAQMSGGQRQRVALGRALVRHPRAFLMDEPLSNLDAALRVHMRGEIVELHRRAGVVTLYVTHDQEEALGMADRIAVMLGGRILQCDAPGVVYRDPAHIDVASFIGSPRINILEAIAGGGLARVGGIALAELPGVADGVAVRLGIRPEDLRLHDHAGAGRLAAQVVRREYLGAEVHAHLRLAVDGTALVARLSPAANEALGAGALFVSADPAHILTFNAEGHRLRLPVHRPEPALVR